MAKPPHEYLTPVHSSKSIISPKGALSTKFSSSKLIKESEICYDKSDKKFDPIKEVPESMYSSVNNSNQFNLKKWVIESNQSFTKDGYEQQEAEHIGEGELTSVYKTTSSDNASHVIFKVFKVLKLLF